MANNDFELDENYDIVIEDGDFAVRNSLIQELGLILSSNKGDWKSDTLIGCNLASKIKSRYSSIALEKTIRIQMQRDSKNYDDIKDFINLELNTI